ncbi:MAG: hypothetical protein ACR2K9_03220 [Solirubrobacteraceae bacterium]
MRTLPSRGLLGGLRMAVGVQALLAPRLSARTFGIDPASSNAWITRLFGSRELLLAASLLGARNEDELRAVAMLGAAVDAPDVLSSAVERRGGGLSGYTTISGGGGAALFVALGLDAARRA